MKWQHYALLIVLLAGFNFTLLFTLLPESGSKLLTDEMYPFSDYKNYWDWHFNFMGDHIHKIILFAIIIFFHKYIGKVWGQLLIFGFLEIIDLVDYKLTHNEFEVGGIDINYFKLIVYVGVIVLTALENFVRNRDN